MQSGQHSPMNRKATAAGLALAVGLAFGAAPAAAAPAYFKDVQGTWSGSGDIVAGKYKGTKFTCNLKGAPMRGASLKIDGTCRVGLFTQKISATIQRGGNGYRGTFLDGAKGKGLDVISGRLRSNKLTVGIKRKELNGALVANLRSRDRLDISISVRSRSRYIPVVGIFLSRVGKTAALR